MSFYGDAHNLCWTRLGPMANTMPAAPAPPATDFWVTLPPRALLALGVLLILFARIHLLDAPLERDEGEYAYMGQLMLHGIPPYAIAANMKFPGVSIVYALVMAVFGQSITAIHLGLLLVNAATIALLYLLARRFFPVTAALAVAASYAVLSSGWSVMGMWAHATHYVVLPAVAGTLLLLRAEGDRPYPNLIGSGLCFGLAILMKQHGVFFGAFAVGYLLVQRRPKDAAILSAAIAVPFALLCAALAQAGVFAKFWFWTIQYAREYATATSLSAGVKMLFESLRYITLANWPLWFAAAAGLYFLWREKHYFLLIFLGVSFLAVCPGFYFRDHYFILMLPAVVLAAGSIAKPGWPLWALTACVFFCIFEQREFLFESNPVMATAAVYGANPFPEAVEVAKFLRANSAPEDKIAILGSEPEILFYADRQSATPYIYTYPLMEAHPFARKMQEDFVHDMETAKPKFVVMVNVAASWLVAPDSPKVLLDWWASKGIKDYQQVGVADILPSGTHYDWSPAYRPRSASHVVLLKRAD